jgi:ABC-type nitrate/sulfonate/bicarbonate transport system substrate-binding protein
MKRASALRFGASAGAAAMYGSIAPARIGAQATNATINIIGARNDSAGIVYYAQDLGYYAQAGLDASVQALNASNAVVGAVLAGTATFGGMTIPGIALAREKGIPIVIAAPSAVYSSATPTAGIFVLKNSPYKKASDLNGKTLTTLDISNMGYYGAKAWIDRNGGDSKTIKWFEMPESAALAAMQSGRVDAAEVSEPALDNAIHGPDARLLASCYDAIGDKFLIAAYFTSVEYAKAHPDVVGRFCDVLLRAAAWANKNHAASGKILEKYIGSPVPPTNTRASYAERVRPADAQPVLDVLFQYGALKKPQHAADLFAPELAGRVN